MDNKEIAKEAIEKSGIKSKMTSWSGPLPPQIIDKISDETANEMVKSLCRRQERQDDIVEKLIQSKENSAKRSDHVKLILTLGSMCFILLLSIVSLFFNKLELIKDIFQILGYISGGSGIAYIIIKNKDTKESEPEITIQ